MLRRVIQNARAVNMPKDKIESAIKRAAGKDAPTTRRSSTRATRRTAIAILVEAATDNPTRTVANVRSHFNKGGGNLGATRQRRLPCSSAWACSASIPPASTRTSSSST